MGVQLNIKDAETVRLARELAEATGQPVTQAIRVRPWSASCNGSSGRTPGTARKGKRDRSGVPRRMPEDRHGKTSREIMDEMYDEDGLPK